MRNILLSEAAAAELVAAIQNSTAVTQPSPVPVTPVKPPVTTQPVSPLSVNADLASKNLPAFMYVVNAVSAPGTPGTTYMPLSGHVLSVPQPQVGEGLLGYYLRTSAQHGGDPQAVGGLLVYQQGYAGQPWELIADSYGVRNPAVAHPAGWVDPYAASTTGATQAGPVAAGGTGSVPWGSSTDADKAFAIKTFKTRPGTNVPVAMSATFSGDVAQWSIWESNNEPYIANFDLASYGGPLKGAI